MAGMYQTKVSGELRSKQQVINENKDTYLSRRSPLEILGDSKQPPIDKICSVYEIKVQPEIVRYYHAAAGFPTKPTWIKAIKNEHYSSWTGLTTKAVTKFFPESDKTWQGHGRKVKLGLQSAKLALNNKLKHHLITKKHP